MKMQTLPGQKNVVYWVWVMWSSSEFKLHQILLGSDFLKFFKFCVFEWYVSNANL